jgi:hypothetical protein
MACLRALSIPLLSFCDPAKWPPTPEPKRPATSLMTRLGLGFGFGGFAPDIASRRWVDVEDGP